MKTGFTKITSLFLAIMPFVFSSCLMGDSEDIPDFGEQLQTDLAIIDKYLEDNSIVAKQDPDGFIRYVIIEDSIGGVAPKIDSCVTAAYRGTFLSNGNEFDKGTASFPLASVIDGWKVGMPLLNEGDSAVLYIPSGLAYGPYGLTNQQGVQVIPKNANLVFHVRLKNVGKYNAATRSCD